VSRQIVVCQEARRNRQQNRISIEPIKYKCELNLFLVEGVYFGFNKILHTERSYFICQKLCCDETSRIKPNMSNTAFILLDLQVGLLDRFREQVPNYLPGVTRALEAARKAKINVIHVRTAFRPGHLEVSSLNFSAAKIAAIGGAIEGSPSVEIGPEVAPIEGEALVTKRRVSAFQGSDLDCLIRGLKVTHLVLAGIATSGAVLSTVRQAADLDFDITVVEDLCFDPDAEVHEMLVKKIFNRQAHVLTSGEWIRSLQTNH
jgi:nicotinamidase-related amidase